MTHFASSQSINQSIQKATEWHRSSTTSHVLDLALRTLNSCRVSWQVVLVLVKAYKARLGLFQKATISSKQETGWENYSEMSHFVPSGTTFQAIFL